VQTAPPPPPAPVRIEQDDSRLAFAGTWQTGTSAVLSGGSQAYTDTPGASVTLALRGTSLALISNRSPAYGSMRVYVNDVLTDTLSLRAAKTSYQQPVWRIEGLDASRVTLVRLEAAGDGFIALDALEVAGELEGAPSPPGPVRFEQDDINITYEGTWTTGHSPVLSGGSQAYTDEPGAAFEVNFTGSQIAFIGNKARSYGSAEVWLDGVKVATLPLTHTSSIYQQVLWSATGLGPGPHSLRVVAQGGGYIALDALEVLGTLDAPDLALARHEDDDARIARSAGWEHWPSPVLSGGGQIYTDTPGEWAQFSFLGTGCTIIAPKASAYGSMRVWVDGTLHSTVSLKSGPTYYQQPVWSVADLPYGVHWVRIETVGDGRIACDAVDVMGSLSGD